MKIGNLGIENWEFVETCGEQLKIAGKMSASSNGSQISQRSQSMQNSKEIFDHTENIKSGPIIYVKEAT